MASCVEEEKQISPCGAPTCSPFPIGRKAKRWTPPFRLRQCRAQKAETQARSIRPTYRQLHRAAGRRRQNRTAKSSNFYFPFLFLCLIRPPLAYRDRCVLRYLLLLFFMSVVEMVSYAMSPPMSSLATASLILHLLLFLGSVLALARDEALAAGPVAAAPAAGGGGTGDASSLSLIRQLPDSTFHVAIDDYGAEGNGLDDDSQAFRDAWQDACSLPFNVTIEVPAGNVYLMYPVELGGPCAAKITLLIMGMIIAPSDPDAWIGRSTQRWLYFHGVNDMIVRGQGSINGMGHEWWARSCKRNASNPCQPAPKAVTFHRVNRLVVEDLVILNSQQMHLAFTSCSHVRASRLYVIAPGDSPNTDGIHISESDYVVVEGCAIRTGDDCISIVSNSSNVEVKNIFCGPGHGISIGSLGKSKAYDQVRNVQVDWSVIMDTENGVRIKTWQGGSGYAGNIVFKNIFMKNVSNPIIIDQYYCDSLIPCHNQTSAVKVEKIFFIGIKGTSATEEAIKISCSDSSPCKRIYIKDVELSLESGLNATSYCWMASGFSSGSVYPPSCLSNDEFDFIEYIGTSGMMTHAEAR